MLSAGVYMSSQLPMLSGYGTSEQVRNYVLTFMLRSVDVCYSVPISEKRIDHDQLGTLINESLSINWSGIWFVFHAVVVSIVADVETAFIGGLCRFVDFGVSVCVFHIFLFIYGRWQALG